MALLPMLGSVASLTVWRAVLIVVAGAVAGTINGVAGGGTLVSFPVLLAMGYPALTANITNTIGIWPGYLTSAAGFRQQIRDQRRRVRQLALLSLAGGAGGAALLLTTSQADFRRVAPWLVLFASTLFAVQPLLTRVLDDPRHHKKRRTLLLTGTFLTAIYGGYFGAGMGVMLLAVLGLAVPDTLARAGGLRTVLSILVNGVAAVVFIVAGSPAWAPVGLLAVGSLAGGLLGAKVALRLPVPVLRAVVVLTGVVTTVALLA